MISYDPLEKTLKKKGYTIYKLQEILGNYNLRVNLNSGRYLELRTVDRICKILDCSVGDIMEYREGEQVITDIVRKRYYVLKWPVIDKLIKDKGMTYTECSVDMGKVPGFLTSLSNLKRTTHRTVKPLADYFEVDVTEIVEY